MRVALATPETATEWDAFVARAAGRTHYHRFGWLRVIERVHGHECLPLTARDEGGALRGVLPLVRVKSPLFGHYLVSMPFLNYGGPLGGAEAVTALAAHAAELARAGGAKLLELRSRDELPLDWPVSRRKITVVLDVPPGDPQALFGTFKAKLRSQVRRPQKEGVNVRFGLDEVEPFYAVFTRHMRDLGTPVQPRALFRALTGEFPESVWFGCAYYQGRAIAAGCGFRWDDEFEMTWASALQGYSRLAPNMLLYWAFMERAALEQVTLFNFGRCTPDSGTHRFKRQWGESRDVPLHWYQRTPTGREAGTPSPDDAAYAWGPRLWKLLPVPVATALGPHIVRGIP
jgi:FemAB-related protein (PEP-CTERM system-associated)